MVLLNAESISIGYDKVLQSELSFSIEHGDILFIRGDNGAGKTTLVKTILKQTKLLGGTLSGLDSLSTQYLPQLIKYELPLSITLKEILDIYEIPENIQRFFGEEILRLRWQDASGGQRQKILILSRLQKETDLLFLDEPFNHVDKKSLGEIIEFFEYLVSEKVIKAMVVISHVMPNRSEKVKELVLQ